MSDIVLMSPICKAPYFFKAKWGCPNNIFTMVNLFPLPKMIFKEFARWQQLLPIEVVIK